MNILVVGGGGREHTIAHNLHQSTRKPHILCAPGNAGTAKIAENVPIQPTEIEALVELAGDRNVELTIVGPEAPLCAGIVDAFETEGLPIFGPTAAAARLEGDKAYAKKLMHESNIPTAEGKSFTRFADAKAYLATRDSAQVVKAAGLAAGKGVVVCNDPAESIVAAERMMVKQTFGDAGSCVVIEEKLEGQELSILALVDGRTIYVLESSQDHKAIGEGDAGPNTGGMGAYSPAPDASLDVINIVESEVLVPVVDALRRRDAPYRGVLYCGLMLTPAGPKVLEFNCRFGDPEAQVVLARLKTDFVDVIEACVDGKLDQIRLEWDDRPSVCVVMSSAGYPGSYKRGKIITGLDDANAMPDVTVYHAGTREINGMVKTNGGRVLGVTALGETIKSARDRAYEAVERIQFDGAYYRRDIAHRAL